MEEQCVASSIEVEQSSLLLCDEIPNLSTLYSIHSTIENRSFLFAFKKLPFEKNELDTYRHFVLYVVIIHCMSEYI